MRERTLSPETREWIEILAGDPCSYCGLPAESVDHIVPPGRGGTDEWDNLTAACLSCNSSKNNRSLWNFLGRRRIRREWQGWFDGPTASVVVA